MITPIIQWIVAAALFAAGLPGWAADTGSWSLKQSAPGVVSASGPLPATATPQPGDFVLRLPGWGEIRGKSLTKASGSARETWLALCVDHSGSMTKSMLDVKSALADAVRSAQSNPASNLRIQAVTFGSAIQAADTFSQEPADTAGFIDALPTERARDGKTKLYDAMATALRGLKNAPPAAARRLIVVSDGNDEGSAASAEAIEKTAVANKIPLDMIGYGELAEASAPIMQSLAQVTKGQFILAGNRAELAQAFQDLLARGAAPPAASGRADVVFNYPPAADQSVVDQASIEYAPAGQTPVQFPLRLESAIIAPASKPGPIDGRDDGYLKIPKFAAPAALAAAALALLVGSVFLLRSRRNTAQGTTPSPAPTPVAPPPVPPQPGPVPRPGRGRTLISPWFAPPAPGQPVAYLLCMAGPLRGGRFPIERELVRLGAGPESDLVIPGDEYISQIHASIRYDASNLYVQDLHSANGTYLNEERLGGSRMPLTPGDRIRVGRTTIELQRA